MANKVTEDCINCAACETECPNDAIAPNGEVYAIDPERCDECASAGGVSACMAVCPADAIVAA
jgi:ferredoxin